MDSSGSLWLLGGTWCQQQLADRSPTRLATCAQQMEPPDRAEEGTATESLLHSWQKCQRVGGGPGTGGTCVACCLSLGHSRSALTQKGLKDCCLALEKFPLI